MKKFTLLTVAACCLASVCNAQIKKGTIFLGGSFAYTQQKLETGGSSEQNEKSSSVMPSAGIAVKPNLVAGVNLIYQGFISGGSLVSTAPHSFYYGGGVFLRKYKPLGRNFNLFGESTLDVRGSKTYPYGTIDNSFSSRGWSINAGFYPGVSYRVSKNLQLEAALGNLISINYNKNNFTNSTISGDHTSKQTSFNFNTFLGGFTGASIGFRIIL